MFIIYFIYFRRLMTLYKNLVHIIETMQICFGIVGFFLFFFFTKTLNQDEMPNEIQIFPYRCKNQERRSSDKKKKER